jgi:hypothetical protein
MGTLFDQLVDQPAEDVCEDASVPEIESVGVFYNRVYADFCTVVDGYAANLERLRLLEDDQGATEYTHAIQNMSKHSVEKEKTDLAKEIRNVLVHRASRQFAPAGVSLEIDTSALHDRFPLDRSYAKPFDADAIWQYLEKTYGNGSGEEEAWRQLANNIIDSFYLKRGKEVKRKGNYVVIDLSVSVDSIDKKYDGSNKLCYHSSESLRKVLRELVTFAEWADRPRLAHDLGTVGPHYQGYKATIESRRQHSCGDEGEIVIVTFTKQFEFRFRSDVAEQFQNFLGTYGTFSEDR